MKKIAILGSTGSIGNSTLNVIEANPGVFSITLLTANLMLIRFLIKLRSLNPNTFI